MFITRERRNEIAWLYILKTMEERAFKPKTVEEICEEIANSLRIKNDRELHDFVVVLLDAFFSKTLQGVWESRVTKQTMLAVAMRNEMAWRIVVAEKCVHGMRIGNFVRREVGNEAKKIGISIQEAREFAQCVIRDVYELTIKDLQC